MASTVPDDEDCTILLTFPSGKCYKKNIRELQTSTGKENIYINTDKSWLESKRAKSINIVMSVLVIKALLVKNCIKKNHRECCNAVVV